MIVWCSAAHLAEEDRPLDDRLFAEAARHARASLRVLTQVDRLDARPWFDEVAAETEIDVHSPIEISAVTGTGLEALADGLRQRLMASGRTGRQWLGMTAARCRESLESVAAALQKVREVFA